MALRKEQTRTEKIEEKSRMETRIKIHEEKMYAHITKHRKPKPKKHPFKVIYQKGQKPVYL